MKNIFCAICVLGIVVFAAKAHTIPEEESSLDAVFGSIAEEAAYLGEILSDVEEALGNDDDLKVESDEYFLRALWEKTKEAVKNATEKVKVSVKGAYNDANDKLSNAVNEAKEKLKAKAAEILSKLLGKITSDYVLEDSIGRMDFIQIIRDLIKAAAQRLFNFGKALEHHQN
ncbi:hypothetical protein HPB50_000105 [Hyalomma asiaticum]|uniref:Uncharacterized protein n=1 Tax=Hyalomma asiaticum TaxID=266040 RepID=A0ACB7SRR4_HYAAI|nr:hypothetical protein HPB50_000105 [Hyalomma asiaticum]